MGRKDYKYIPIRVDIYNQIMHYVKTMPYRGPTDFVIEAIRMRIMQLQKMERGDS